MPGRHPLYVPGWVTGRRPDGEPGDVVLVEGVFDAIKVHVATGKEVVALGGKQLARYLLHDLLKLRPRNVRIMLDSDALGAALTLSSKLAPFVDSIERIAVPDGEDPGSMDYEAIREALR
jgi:DNA primase